MCGCITLEEKCLLSVSATAPSLSRAPTVTNATAGTLPRSARYPQVCVQLTEKERERKSQGQKDIQMGGIGEIRSEGG